MTTILSLRRLATVMMAMIFLGMTASPTEALPIPIGARLRIAGPAIPKKHRIGVLVGFGDSAVRIRVSRSEVVSFPISGIETVEVAEGRGTSWRKVALTTAAGVGFALALHGPRPVGEDPVNYYGGRETFCGTYDLFCTFHLSRDRAIAVGLFGLAGVAGGRKTTHWVHALPADLTRPSSDQSSTLPPGPPLPSVPAASPRVGESRAGARIRLELSDGKSVKGTLLTSSSATQWTILHDEDGTVENYERKRVTRVMEADGTKRHWRKGAIVGAVLGTIFGLADAPECDGCAKSGHVASSVAGAVAVDALIGLCIKTEKWKQFTGDRIPEHGGGPSLQVEPRAGRRGVGITLRLAW